MKKFYFLLIVGIISINSINVFAGAPTPPAIDGDSTDAVWSAIPFDSVRHMTSKHNVQADTNYKDLSGRFKVYWDQDALYVLGHVTDDVIVRPKGPKTPSQLDFNWDNFEVYLDKDNSKNVLPEGSSYTQSAYDTNDSQVRFIIGTDSVSNTSGGGGYIPTTKAAKDLIKGQVKMVYDKPDTSGGYTIEMKILWSAMGPSAWVPAVGDTIGFDIVLNDNDEGTRDRQMAWKTFHDDIFNNPSMMGVLKLNADGSLTSLNDNEAPSKILNLVAFDTANTITVKWDASTDNNAVAFYEVTDGKLVTKTTNNYYKKTGASYNTKYVFQVAAFDNAYNKSKGAGITFTSGKDTLVPSKPLNFKVLKVNKNVITFSWNASTDNDKIWRYKIYKLSSNKDTIPGAIYTTSALGATVDKFVWDTTYQISIYALDIANNKSDSSTITVVIGKNPISLTSSYGYQVYPNPVKDLLSINNAATIQLVQVVNVCGQVVKTITNHNASLIEMDFSDFVEGIYFVKIKNNDGTVTIEKLIKQ